MNIIPKLERLIFFLITSSVGYILIYNFYHYSPILGYDAEAHYTYVDYISRYLPRSIKLPTSLDTREFLIHPLDTLYRQCLK